MVLFTVFKQFDTRASAAELLPLAMQRPDQRRVKPAAVTSIDP